jgi:hypothetical protein
VNAVPGLSVQFDLGVEIAHVEHHLRFSTSMRDILVGNSDAPLSLTGKTLVVALVVDLQYLKPRPDIGTTYIY